MPTATAKIRDGLNQRAREKNPDSIPLENLSGAPSSVADLATIANRLLDKRTHLVNLVANNVKHIREHREKKRAEFAEIGIIREETAAGAVLRTDTLGADQRRAMLEKEMASYTKAVRANTEKDRAALYREIRDTMAKVRVTRDTLADPTAILMRMTRLDPDRATAAAILSHSGPREVEAALQDAVLIKNKALAAAALSRMDAMDKSARDSIRFSRGDVAAAIVGEEANRANRFLAALDLAEIDADIAWAESEGKATDRLVTRRGIKQRELQHYLGEESSDD